MQRVSEMALRLAARIHNKKEEGATMVEYGLMVALIAVVAAVGAATLGTNVNAMFDTIAGKIK